MARTSEGLDGTHRPTLKDRVTSTVGAVQGSQAWSSIFRPGSIFLPFVIVIFMAIRFWRVRKDGGISGPL